MPVRDSSPNALAVRLQHWARYVCELDEQVRQRELRGEAFLFEPDWGRAEWVAMLLSYLEAFGPDEAVALVFILREEDATPTSRAAAETRVRDILARTGRERIPPVMVAEGSGEQSALLDTFKKHQWLSGGGVLMTGLTGVNGRRLASARSRLGV